MGENGGFQIQSRHAKVLSWLFRAYDSKIHADLDFVKYAEKSLRFRKYPAKNGRSNTIQKRCMWTQTFLNTEQH